MERPSQPDYQQAEQFCLMLQAGLPGSEAIRYFFPEIDDPAEFGRILKVWKHSKPVGQAWDRLQGKKWTSMSLDERIRTGLERTRAAMAYYLYSVNYAEANPSEKNKLDTARAALEAYVAGNAGKSTPLEDFLADMRAGKYKKLEPAKSIELPN